jgi:carbamoyl-phosphate synthase large subunit
MITALVTGVGGRSVGYQILESLFKYKNDYRLIATGDDSFSPGLYEADNGYLVPNANSSGYIRALIKISKKEKVKVILPGSLPEISVIAKNEKIFLKEGIVPITNSYSLIVATEDKLDVYNLLRKNNILTPETRELISINDANGLQYPLIIKPRGETSGSRNVHILKDKSELIDIFQKLGQKNIKLLVQEYVGTEDEEYTVGVVVGKDKRIIDTVVMRRKLIGLSRGEERRINSKEYVLSTGYSQGFFVDQPDVKKYCEKAATLLGARGPFNIQCRKGKKGVYIFEVHPRFSGSASMRAEMGFNEPHILIKEFLGIERISKIQHKLGYAVMRKFANTVVKIDDYEKIKKKI